MPGYLIIQMNVQVMDVMYQIQAHGDIAQAHHIRVIQLRLGVSLEMATWVATV